MTTCIKQQKFLDKTAILLWVIAGFALFSGVVARPLDPVPDGWQRVLVNFANAVASIVWDGAAGVGFSYPLMIFWVISLVLSGYIFLKRRNGKLARTTAIFLTVSVFILNIPYAILNFLAWILIAILVVNIMKKDLWGVAASPDCVSSPEENQQSYSPGILLEVLAIIFMVLSIVTCFAVILLRMMIRANS